MSDTGRLVVTVVVEADDEEALGVAIDHATASLTEQFPTYDGFVAGQLERDPDALRVHQRVVWRDEAAWAASRDDDRWDTLPSAVALARMLEAGRLWLDVSHWLSLIDTSAPTTD